MGDPTFYRWKDAISINPPKYPNRQRGTSGSFLLGGIHLTHYTYLPFRLLNILSATECDDKNHVFLIEGISYLRENHSLKKIEEYLQKREFNGRVRLLKDVKEDLSKIVVLPWFYECNKERYPAWKGEHDNRVS